MRVQLPLCSKSVMARLGDGWVWNGKRYDDEGQPGEHIDRPDCNGCWRTFVSERSIES